MGRLAQASEQLRQLRKQLDVVLAPRREAIARVAERARLQSELAAFETSSSDAPPEGPHELSQVTTKQGKAILVALGPLEKRLQALSKLCEAAPGHAPLQALNRHFKRTKKHDLPGFEQALASAGLALELPLPPPPLVSAGMEQQ